MKGVYQEFGGVVKKVEGVVETTNRVIEPVRSSAFRRFPTMFTFLVAFGVGATFLVLSELLR